MHKDDKFSDTEELIRNTAVLSSVQNLKFALVITRIGTMKKSAVAVQNLNSVAHIALLAVANTAIVTKSDCSYRSFKSVKRIA